MKKVELLSPVGNKEMLYQAIHNGCDAVYLSGSNYGARKYADNFNNEELVNAIKYSHLYGVKVYVTVNTLIYESEINDVIEYLGFLHKNGVDAVIMQDMGLIKLTRTIYPNLEIHASTQCHNHNEEIIKLWRELGVERVVFAREMSLEEIKNINVDIEKEIFVYGALCVCYSGCCLFSSLNGGKSGNRGECVGSCRLPYKLVKNEEVLSTKGEYLLSTKEINTLDYLKELIESGVTSFKIEGRMKSPSYVGYVTRIYRTLIDKYYNGEEVKLTKEEVDNLKKLFNRGFSSGYLFKDKNIMNIKTPNHQGIEIGKVIEVYKDKIKVKLFDNLRQNDGIRFKLKDKGMIVNRLYNSKNLLVNEVLKDNICILDNKFNIKVGDTLLKTIDSKLVSSLKLVDEKKIEIQMDVKCFIGKPLELIVSDSTNTLTLYKDIIDKSLNKEVTIDDIKKQLSKLGNTPFKLSNINIEKDNNIFINLKSLNEIRREAVEKLISLRENREVNYVKNTYIDNSIYKDNNNIKLSILVRNEEQLNICINYNIDNIYTDNYELYKKYKYFTNLYYRLDRVNNNYTNYKDERLLVTELGSVYKYYKENTLIGDYFLNITNHHSINLLKLYNINKVTLSVELDKYKIKDIIKYSNNVELILYGRLELMVMKYCPLKECLNYCSSCKNSKDKFYLQDKFNNKYPIIRKNCINHIMHHKVVDKFEDLSYYKEIGIKNYRLELFNESKDEVIELINKFRNNC